MAVVCWLIDWLTGVSVDVVIVQDVIVVNVAVFVDVFRSIEHYPLTPKILNAHSSNLPAGLIPLAASSGVVPAASTLGGLTEARKTFLKEPSPSFNTRESELTTSTTFPTKFFSLESIVGPEGEKSFHNLQRIGRQFIP